jgi:phosphoribosylformylglycinamidine (FGAM) synthase-like enzyme
MSPEEIQTSKIYREWGLTDQEYFKIKDEILGGRLPNFTETGMYAVMWSEHCCYKNSKKCFEKISNRRTASFDGTWRRSGCCRHRR